MPASGHLRLPPNKLLVFLIAVYDSFGSNSLERLADFLSRVEHLNVGIESWLGAANGHLDVGMRGLRFGARNFPGRYSVRKATSVCASFLLPCSVHVELT